MTTSAHEVPSLEYILVHFCALVHDVEDNNHNFGDNNKPLVPGDETCEEAVLAKTSRIDKVSPNAFHGVLEQWAGVFESEKHGGNGMPTGFSPPKRKQAGWFPCLLGLLGCGEELSLKKITIRLNLEDLISAKDATQWAMLDKLLSQSRFPELASLRVILKTTADIDADQTKEVIRSPCPTLCTRNVCIWEVEASSDTKCDRKYVESDSESVEDDNEFTGGDGGSAEIDICNVKETEYGRAM
ncbi:hypothetical protein DFS33DRAFT_1271133 [Desarmillaria ectypa]|nr:hypothetical protein DFS33DRAFT_1271133 [Desarmillaria ectypa]